LDCIYPIHSLRSSTQVYDYTGTFNSTANPSMLAPTISIELGQDLTSHLTGRATLMNSPCISSLALSGHALGDALSLSDAANKVFVIALPTQPTAPTSNSFTFDFKFDPTATNCTGDVGGGVLTMIPSPFDSKLLHSLSPVVATSS
jgi:hypothetical protein